MGKRSSYQLQSLAANYEYRLIQLENEIKETIKELFVDNCAYEYELFNEDTRISDLIDIIYKYKN